MGFTSILSAKPTPMRSTPAPKERMGLKELATCDGVASTTRFCAAAVPATQQEAETDVDKSLDLTLDDCHIAADGWQTGGASLEAEAVE